MQRSYAAALLHQHLVLDLDIEGRGIALEPVSFKLHVDAGLGKLEHVVIEEHLQHLHVIEAECTQQDAGWQLATTIDAHKQRILGIEFEIEPGAAIGDDPRGKK